MLATVNTGEKLRRERRAGGLTQVELAERSGVAQSTIAQIEGGVRENPHPGPSRSWPKRWAWRPATCSPTLRTSAVIRPPEVENQPDVSTSTSFGANTKPGLQLGGEPKRQGNYVPRVFGISPGQTA